MAQCSREETKLIPVHSCSLQLTIKTDLFVVLTEINLKRNQLKERWHRNKDKEVLKDESLECPSNPT